MTTPHVDNQWLFQALQYEEDGKECTLHWPIENHGPLADLKASLPEGLKVVLEELWLKGEVTVTIPVWCFRPIVGTPVVCQRLVGAKHLNGKLGDLRSYDYEGQTDRYLIHFEDDSLKPCLVNPENVRILFELPDMSS